MSRTTSTIRAGKAAALALAVGTGIAAAPAMADTQVMYVLDGSNSMWGQIDGVAKIQTAKEVLGELLEAEGAQKVGLLAYGHRSKTDCGDIEVLAPVGAGAGELKAGIGKVTPTGKTPISAALKAAAEALPAGDHQNNIVLISDGLETCNADPCATAQALAAQGVNTRIHVVGFDIGAEDREKLECIAVNGGVYVDARSADDLKGALTQVAEVVAEPEPAPAPEPEPEPQAVETFRDDFDQGELAGHWQVAQPNPDGFIVEDGSLVLIAGQKGTMADPEKENLFLLDVPLPDGDWEMEVVYDAEFNTRHEILQFGLYDDAENFLVVSSGLGGRFAYNCALEIGMDDMSRGQLKENRTNLGDWEACQGDVVGFMKRKGIGPRPYKITLVKEGRSYSATHQFGDEVPEGEEPRIEKSGAVSSLRAPKGVALTVGQVADTKGETLFLIDRVVVRQRN